MFIRIITLLTPQCIQKYVHARKPILPVQIQLFLEWKSQTTKQVIILFMYWKQ